MLLQQIEHSDSTVTCKLETINLDLVRSALLIGNSVDKLMQLRVCILNIGIRGYLILSSLSILIHSVTLLWYLNFRHLS